MVAFIEILACQMNKTVTPCRCRTPPLCSWLNVSVVATWWLRHKSSEDDESVLSLAERFRFFFLLSTSTQDKKRRKGELPKAASKTDD